MKDPYRRINAILAAVIGAFFLIHGVMGCLLLLVPGFPSELEVVVWVGASLVCIHIIMSIITTQRMLTDTVRPPSQRKKKHQLLKWITGVLLLAAVALHLILPKETLWGVVALLLIVVTLAVHSYTGIKSLTRDLDLDKSWRLPLRVIVIVAAIALGVALLVHLL